MHALRCFWIFLCLAVSGNAVAQEAKPAAQVPQPAHPEVRFATNLGEVVIELWPDAAPATVENFLQYVRSGFYDGVIFHRVVPGFVVQAGGYDAKMARKETRDPIVNESKMSVKNARGTLSMARTSAPNSATSQFFINLQDNPSLNAKPNQPGYAVFGQVVKGMEVVDKMAELPQGAHSGVFSNAPNEPVVIEKASVVQSPAPAGE